MPEVDRLPCRKCRQPVGLDEPDCPNCGACLLVDVVLHGGIRDTRLRYQLSKALEALPGAPPLPTIQRGLASATPALRGVTRAFAHEMLPILGQNGVRGGIENHSPERRGGVPSLRWLLGAAGAAALLAVFYVGWLQVVRWIEPAKVRIIGSAPPERSGSASSHARGPLAAPTAPPRSARELAKSGLAATVSLRCSNSVGSGFFVTSDLVLTNAHVLCGSGDSVAVTTADGRAFTGTVVRRAAGIDLAIVRVAGAKASPLPLGDVGDLAVGDRVVMVGSPLGLDFTVHEGSISSLGRSSERTAYIQLDAKVNPGNSGGPIIDEQGRAVGVVSIKITGEGVDGIGLALPINYAYSGALGFVPPPTPAAAASAAFASMLARALSGGGDLQQTAAEPGPAVPAGTPRSEDRPLLVAARVDQYRNLVVRVVRITDQEPRFEELTVKLWRGLEVFCTMRGDIRTWKKADAQLAASGMDARLATALRQVANGRTMYVGESILRWDLCDYRNFGAGMEMELEGAHPMASRIRVY